MERQLIQLMTFTTTLLAVHSAVSVDIYWNKSNQIFKESNGHILELALKDQVKFHCPHDGSMTPLEEYYIIYRVPKMYYDSCSLPMEVENYKLKTLGIHRVITCSDPSKSKSFTTVLDEFSPLPGSHGGLMYRRGHTYYFISTSSGTIEGLENRKSQNSSCENDRMRLKLTVLHNNEVERPVRQYPSTQRRETSTVKPIYQPEPRVTAHVRRHDRPGLQNDPPKRADYSTIGDETTTTVFQRPKYPQAIINAGVTLNTSSAGVEHAGYRPLVLVLSLLLILYYSMR